jgi:hypothetical protein
MKIKKKKKNGEWTLLDGGNKNFQATKGSRQQAYRWVLNRILKVEPKMT